MMIRFLITGGIIWNAPVRKSVIVRQKLRLQVNVLRKARLHFQYEVYAGTYPRAELLKSDIFLRADQIPGLRGRITTHIYNFFCSNLQEFCYQLFRHTCPRGISNDHIWPAMCFKKNDQYTMPLHHRKKMLHGLHLINQAFSLASSMASESIQCPPFFLA